MADKIRRLFLGADSLWAFLPQAAASNNKLAAFRKLDCGLSDSAPYRIWKRFIQAQTNLAHCFSCGRNFNNIDLLMTQGYDFVPAVEILEQWLRQYQKDRGSATS